MATCNGSVRPASAPGCGLPATWSICCANLTCSAQDILVCDWHEVEARAMIVDWFTTGGVCRVCDAPYDSVDHATSKWFQLT